MIPKKIHYCWFGGKEKPELAKKCIASLQAFCPDWEITEWNETNFDFSSYPYAQYCLEKGHWAFLSDFVRLAVVAEQGGVYFDTDVELIRPIEALLEHDAYFGFEDGSHINTGLGFGARAGHNTVVAMLDEYLTLRPETDGSYPLITCPRLNTAALAKLGLTPNGLLQTVAGAVILPADYLNPYEYTTGITRKTENTYSIHWYTQSWVSPAAQLRSKLTRPFHRVFGADCFRWLKKKEGKL